MTVRGFHALVVAAAALAVPAQANADPLFIQSGLVTVTGPSDDVMNFSFAGDGFNVQGRGLDFGFVGPNLSCMPCGPGDSIGFNTNFIVPGEGSAQLNGVNYPDLNFHLFFELQGGSSPFVPNGPVTTVSAPFTFGRTSGAEIRGFPPDVSPVSQPLESIFIVNLFGAGTATATFTEGLGGHYFSSVTYAFEPVPEPATLVLIGPGIAAFAIKRRRRALESRQKVPGTRPTEES